MISAAEALQLSSREDAEDTILNKIEQEIVDAARQHEVSVYVCNVLVSKSIKKNINNILKSNKYNVIWVELEDEYKELCNVERNYKLYNIIINWRK